MDADSGGRAGFSVGTPDSPLRALLSQAKPKALEKKKYRLVSSGRARRRAFESGRNWWVWPLLAAIMMTAGRC
jgi:hypothetical protein